MLAWWGTLGGVVGYDAHRHRWVWNPTEDKILRQFATAQKTTRAAAAKIKCTFNIARHRAEALGIHFRPKLFHPTAWTAREDNELRAAAAAGEPIGVVAVRIERGDASARRRAKRLGIVFAPEHSLDHWTEEALQRARTWWLEGISGGEIAKRLGPAFTRSSIIGKMHRKGWVRDSATQARATRVEIQKRRAKVRRQKRLKIRANPIHPLQRLINWQGPPRPPKHFTARIDDVARVTHEQLAAKHCRWPVGKTDEVFKPFYCGQPRVPGLPYCQAHCVRAFNVISPFPRQVYPTPDVI